MYPRNRERLGYPAYEPVSSAFTRADEMSQRGDDTDDAEELYGLLLGSFKV